MVVFLVFPIRDLAGTHTSLFFGIVTFLLLPALFVMGLLLIPRASFASAGEVPHGRRLIHTGRPFIFGTPAPVAWSWSCC